ncbi:MAG: hypothetical protein LBD14_03260, partial [Puniceicoccales bacterium]|nr:hypothetical protein [Puniceicoccales bacterium]
CERRHALFMARKIMLALFRPLKSTKPIQSMIIALHKNARTTPAIRAEIAASTNSINSAILGHRIQRVHQRPES